MTSRRRPRVAVVFTGGTISMTIDRLAGGAVPTLAGGDLLERVPGLADLADLVPIDRGRTPASHFSFADIVALRGVIDAALADPDLAGVVVVQGTDVLEETSFAWDLYHRDERPVIVTGAMRNASEPAWDGPANLRAAVKAAGHRAVRGHGVLVAFNGRLIPASDVGKLHATGLDAFRSRNGRQAGTVGERGLRIGVPGPRRVLPETPPAAAGPIALLVAALETDGAWLDRAVAAGARGIVVAATGSGNTHPDLLRAAVDAMAAGLPVVLASRTGAGPVGPFYAFPGGGATWERAGAIFAGTLSPVQARVALALGLGAGLRSDGLRGLLADPA